jgi:UDP-glucose 4-epimerase
LFDNLPRVSTAIVTGGAGFIGSHLCERLLAEGHRVITIDDLTEGHIANLAEARGYGKQFTFTHMDIRSDGIRTLFARHHPEIVYHLAAQASVSASVADPMLDASVNVIGLLNVLEASVAAGARKIVVASSGGTLYGTTRSFPVREISRRGAHPVSPYGITKKVAEDYLLFYRRSRGLDFTALALGNVYGPRQDPHGEAGVVAIFASRMLAGQAPVLFGDGRQTRDYVYIDDTVHAFALAADRGSGQVFNVGTGVETSVNRIFELLARATKFSGQPVHGPPREGDVRRSALSNELAGEELGWKPWTTLEEGLQATVESLRPR